MSGSFDLRRLRYFIKVAELGSLTRAAEALHLTPPAVTMQVKELESAAKLMEKSPFSAGDIARIALDASERGESYGLALALCGACGTVCPTGYACVTGACALSCATGQTACSGTWTRCASTPSATTT